MSGVFPSQEERVGIERNGAPTQLTTPMIGPASGGRPALEFLLSIGLRCFPSYLSRRAVARPRIDDYFGGFLIAEFLRIDDKMIVMRIGDVHAEIAADMLLTGAIGFFNVSGRILFTELETICDVLHA